MSDTPKARLSDGRNNPEYNADYRLKNADRLRTQKALYYQRRKTSDPELLRKQYLRKVALVEINGLSQEYLRAARERQASYIERHPEKYNDRLARDVKRRHSLVVALGGRCVTCGYDTDIRALVLDHIIGDGWKDRATLGSKLFRYYVNHLDEAIVKLQVLCANCNQIKSIENKEHNRTRRKKK